MAAASIIHISYFPKNVSFHPGSAMKQCIDYFISYLQTLKVFNDIEVEKFLKVPDFHLTAKTIIKD